MKLNWAERWAVNNPSRVFQQRIEIYWFKKKMPLRVGAHVLEVGCGRGVGARLIVEAFRPKIIHCLDLDWEMVIKAKAYTRGLKGDGIFFHTGDISHLPFRDGSMDVVFGFGVVHHVLEWRRALAEIARVLKPDGIYYMEELYPSLYQNIITRHILLHPRKDRFQSPDLKAALLSLDLSIQHAVENKWLGILATIRKRGVSDR